MRRRDVLRLLGLSPLAPWLGAPVPGQARVPGQAQPGAPADVELALSAEPGEVQILPGAPTRVWRFTVRLLRGPAHTIETMNASYLGPVIRLRRGQRVRVRFLNQIGEPSIVHWHGLNVRELADGHPRFAVGHGAEYVYDFTVANRAGTYWYHPHPHMRTGAQVNAGLAGLLLVSDPEEDALGLPSGAGEIHGVLQDRRFDAGNQFLYLESAPAPGRGGGRGGMRAMGRGMGGMSEAVGGWFGDRMLVNGRVQPVMDVDRRSYRVRLLNGSSARIYKLAWSDGSPVVMIGSDGGLLDRPRTMPAVTLAPAQRADLLLDLSRHRGGSTLALQSLAFPSAVGAAAGNVGMAASSSRVPQGAALTLMTLRVSNASGPRFEVPTRLSADEFRPDPSAPVRRVPLAFRQMRWRVDGRVFDLANVAEEETVAAGSTHVWEFVNEPNAMGMRIAHPMHLHGRQFRVVSRAGGAPNALRETINDAGALDTVLVLPGETVRIQVTFSDQPGLFLYHCHTLEHEDMGMMRNFRIRA